MRASARAIICGHTSQASRRSGWSSDVSIGADSTSSSAVSGSSPAGRVGGREAKHAARDASATHLMPRPLPCDSVRGEHPDVVRRRRRDLHDALLRKRRNLLPPCCGAVEQSRGGAQIELAFCDGDQHPAAGRHLRGPRRSVEMEQLAAAIFDPDVITCRGGDGEQVALLESPDVLRRDDACGYEVDASPVSVALAPQHRRAPADRPHVALARAGHRRQVGRGEERGERGSTEVLAPSECTDDPCFAVRSDGERSGPRILDRVKRVRRDRDPVRFWDQPAFRMPPRVPLFAGAAAPLPGRADSKSFTKRKAFGTLATAKPANAKVLPLWRILSLPSSMLTFSTSESRQRFVPPKSFRTETCCRSSDSELPKCASSPRSSAERRAGDCAAV